MALCCLAWIRDVVDLLIAGKRFEISMLSDDVIIEILVKLPAKDVLNCRRLYRQWESLASTPLFTQLHLKRTATPSLLMQFYPRPVTESREFICFEVDADNKKLKYSEIHSELLKNLSQYRPCLMGSCDGLLLFEAVKDGVTRILVINPITKERVSYTPPVVQPSGTVSVCSIFFHPSKRDYIVLYWHQQCYEYQYLHPGNCCNRGYCYRYYTYALCAKTRKEITAPRFRYHPSSDAISTVLVNGCIHWMVRQHVEHYKDIPSNSCKHSIMVYSIDDEELLALPHPGPKCLLGESHERMYLFEVEEEVMCVHVSQKSPVVNIWVLEDYGKWAWAKTYEVDLHWMNTRFPTGYPSLFPNLTLEIWVLSIPPILPFEIRVLSIQNDELLFNWAGKGVFCYNLKLRRVWMIMEGAEIARRFERFGMAITYTESLVRPGLLQCSCISSCLCSTF